MHKGHIQKKHSHCHLQLHNSLLHPNHYWIPWLFHHTMLMPFEVLPFTKQPVFGAAFWPIVQVFL